MKHCNFRYTNPQGQKSTRRITGSASQRVNALRLSDIAKLIHGRHGGACYEYEWAKRYFFAALPHLIASRLRWRDAVRAWVVQWAPAFLLEDDGAWVSEQAALCFEKKRRFPGNDKLAKLLGVQPDETAKFGLRTIPAMTRPKAVRKAERKIKDAAGALRRRANKPGHKPHAASEAAAARAEGINPSTARARKRRARIAQERAQTMEIKSAPEPAHRTTTTGTITFCETAHEPTTGSIRPAHDNPVAPLEARDEDAPHRALRE